VDKRFRTWVFVCDVLAVCISIVAAVIVQFRFRVPSPVSATIARLGPFLVLVAIAVFTLFGLYRAPMSNVSHAAVQVAVASSVMWVLAMAIAYGTMQYSYPRRAILITWVAQVILMVLARAVLSSVYRRHGPTQRILLVCGASGDSRLVTEFLFNPALGFELVALCDADELLNTDRIGQEVDALCVDHTVPRDQVELVAEWAQRNHKDLYVVPRLLDILLQRSSIAQIGDTPLFRMDRLGLNQVEVVVKRLMDVFLAILGLALSLPLYPLVAVAIYLESRGPVLYSQERVGQGGAIFKVLKFRTMIPDAEKQVGPVLAAACDHRVTRVGRFLRACRFDELPQMINILKGEMSFVGPRPERPAFVQRFSEQFPAYQYRHMVKPGLTGLAQVQATYSTPAEEKLRYDLMYISNYSILLDLQILAQTLAVVLTPSRAAGFGGTRTTPDHTLNGLRETWKQIVATDATEEGE
jgi:exopolysaccharide biosynthesis polyprenyl glycosylphosphotransferase